MWHWHLKEPQSEEYWGPQSSIDMLTISLQKCPDPQKLTGPDQECLDRPTVLKPQYEARSTEPPDWPDQLKLNGPFQDQPDKLSNAPTPLTNLAEHQRLLRLIAQDMPLPSKARTIKKRQAKTATLQGSKGSDTDQKPTCIWGANCKDPACARQHPLPQGGPTTQELAEIYQLAEIIDTSQRILSAVETED